MWEVLFRSEACARNGLDALQKEADPRCHAANMPSPAVFIEKVTNEVIGKAFRVNLCDCRHGCPRQLEWIIVGPKGTPDFHIFTHSVGKGVGKNGLFASSD